MVMRRIGFIGLLLLGVLVLLSSCVREVQEEMTASWDDAAVEGQPVTITFNMLGPAPAPDTRTLGEGREDLHTLHLAVFGGSGYLKEYVEAKPLGAPQDYTYQTIDGDNHPVSVTVKSYSYSVTLALSDSPRTIQFIGNGPETLPFGYDTAIIPVLRGAAGEMSYWQILSLPNGIRAKRNGDGAFINEAGEVIPDGGTGYIADVATEQCFQDIPLVRNWAKVVLEVAEGSTFTPERFALVNVPNRGAIAPYSATHGFIYSYESYGFQQLETLPYPANLPSGTTFNTHIPERGDFEGAAPGEGVVDAEGGALYLYERPVPTDGFPPTYVIVYGYYNNPDDPGHAGYYYYKIDLMETWSETVGGKTVWKSSYYPIFRNFKYRIVINKVRSAGHASPRDAVNSVGSGDVSANITTSQLADISDGSARLIISPWMAQTYTEEHGDQNPAITDLQAYFSKSPTGEADLDAGSVEVELLPPDDEGDDILYDLQIDSVPGADGWRHISFKNYGPGRTLRSQTIRVTGSYATGRLYRDIVITVQPIQPMKVSCDRKISSTKGAQQRVTISIPDGLMESVFPLDYIIEPEDMTLTPDTDVSGNNLPVLAGKSISENAPYMGRTAFHFKRSLSWQEYKSLPRTQDGEGQSWRSFTCYFRSNCEESSTRVWVYNPFFDKASDFFVTRHDRRFSNPAFQAPIYEDQPDRPLPVAFDMSHDSDDVYPDDYPPVMITVSGLNLPTEILAAHSNITRDESNANVYYYTPGSAEDSHIVLDFMTTTANPDEISVNLTAERYYASQIAPVRFPMAQFVDGHPLRNTTDNNWSNSTWSNVAWGYINKDKDKTLVFGYKHHPDLPNPTVTLEMISGLREYDNADITTVTVTPGPRHPDGDQDYHEIELRTKGGTADTKMLLKANGYVVKQIQTGRFNGNIRTLKSITSQAFSKNNTLGFSQETPYFNFTEDNGSIRVSFDRISAQPNGSVTFATAEDIPGRTYTMTLESTTDGQTLLWADMFFKVDGSTILMPDPNLFNPSVGTVFRYWGSNNQYVWSIPRGNKTATLTFTAPPEHNVVLTTFYVKTFNGSVLEGGQTVN